MKKNHYVLASGAVSLALLIATPALADSDNGVRVKADGSFGLGPIVRFLAQGEHEKGIGKVVRDLAHGERDKHDNDNDRDDNHATSTVMVTGSISAISGSDIVVNGNNGTTYTVHAAGATLSGNGNVVVLADLKVGDTVVIRGTLDGTVITALKIRDLSLAQRSFLNAVGAVGAGVVTSVSGSTFTIDPIGKQTTTTVTTNASTTYVQNGAATTSSALGVGSKVFIAGTTTSDTTIAASIVSIWNSGISFLRHLLFLR